jgi:xanthine dehydrogenase accessory factor
MREILDDIDRWRASGQPIALATVVATWGSAPRAAGAKMAMTADGQIAGSVSGGCVEAAVVETGTEVLSTGTPRLLHFGVTDEKAWEVGLACGGKISIFVERLDETFSRALSEAASSGRAYAVATVTRGPVALLGQKMIVGDAVTAGGAFPEEIARRVAREAPDALRTGESRRFEAGCGGTEPCEIFLEVVRPAPRLVAVGGVHIAVALTALARTLGYWTAVIDPRQVFGNAERFPNADLLLSDWPDEGLGRIGLDSSTAVAVLTHDPKLDDAALAAALASDAFYVGALGSRKTQEKRRARLLAAGLTEEQLSRLHAPIGLDLGGRSPEEIALAVMAQIVAARNGRPAPAPAPSLPG